MTHMKSLDDAVSRGGKATRLFKQMGCAFHLVLTQKPYRMQFAGLLIGLKIEPD